MLKFSFKTQFTTDASSKTEFKVEVKTKLWF